MMERASPRSVWRQSRALLRPVRRYYVAAAVAVVISTLITLAGPALVRYAVDAGIKKHSYGPLDKAALIFLGLALLKPFVVRAQTLFAASAGERFLDALRNATFEKLQSLPLGFFEQERAGVLVSRLTSDVQSLTELVREALIEVIGSALQIVLTIAALLVLSPTLAAISLVALPVLVGSSWSFHHSAGRVYHAIRDRVAETLTAVQEGLAGVRVVQAFRREKRTLERYRPRSQAQVSAWRRASFVNIRLFAFLPAAQAIALIAVLLVAASMYRQGSISIGTITAFVLYLVQLFDPIGRFTEWLGDFRQGLAALAKIVGLLEAPSAIVERARPIELPREGVLALDRVTFGYDSSRPVVCDVSLELTPGEHVALVGATGAGKSTLAKLLTRQYDPQQGTITLGGADLRDASLDSLHNRIVMLPQEGHLFSGTIADNIRVAHPNTSDDDVHAALNRIGALARFESLPNGLATDVQTRGLRLSAGERQLVGIARVALADPAVIVLDEATSSLDPGTEMLVERALAAVAEGRTVVTIAHRLSTAERADRVVVMEHGRVVEVASHDELVEQGDRYARLWASWQAGLAASGTCPRIRDRHRSLYGEPRQEDPMSDRESIEQMLEIYRRAAYAKDVDAFVALFDDNVRVFDMWGRWSYDGAGEWRGVVNEWFGSLGNEKVAVDFDEVQTVIGDGVAAASAFVTFKGLSADDEELRAMNNRLSWVLRKTGEGEWKVVHEHTSAPIDFETSKAILGR